MRPVTHLSLHDDSWVMNTNRHHPVPNSVIYIQETLHGWRVTDSDETQRVLNKSKKNEKLKVQEKEY
jgi:hypothetical protein